MNSYSEQSIATPFAGKGLVGFIQKPFRLDELLALQRATVDAPRAGDATE